MIPAHRELCAIISIDHSFRAQSLFIRATRRNYFVSVSENIGFDLGALVCCVGYVLERGGNYKGKQGYINNIDFQWRLFARVKNRPIVRRDATIVN